MLVDHYKNRYNLFFRELVGCVSVVAVILGFRYQLIGCLWLLVVLILNGLIKVWHDWLVPGLWSLGLLFDLLVGNNLGFSGCWLLLQIIIAKTVLARRLKLCICWLIVSSVGWLWLIQQ